MLPRSRNRARRAAAIGLALLFAVPAAAALVRVTVHFSASFDLASAPGGGLQAEVGQITVVAPPTEFVVTAAADGGGELKIHDAGTQSEAVLVGTFKTLFKGQQLDATWTQRAAQSDSPLDIRFADDNDAGMIDVGFDDGGMIIAGGEQVMPYVPGTDYAVEVCLSTPMVGQATWSVRVTPLDGTAAVEATGLLSGSGPLFVKSVKIVRPAGASAGLFFVDDLKAVSSSPTFK